MLNIQENVIPTISINNLSIELEIKYSKKNHQYSDLVARSETLKAFSIVHIFRDLVNEIIFQFSLL